MLGQGKHTDGRSDDADDQAGNAAFEKESELLVYRRHCFISWYSAAAIYLDRLRSSGSRVRQLILNPGASRKSAPFMCSKPVPGMRGACSPALAAPPQELALRWPRR